MANRLHARVVIAIACVVACKKDPAPSDAETTGGDTTFVDPSATTSESSTADVIDPTNETNPGGTNCCELHDGIGCDEAAVQSCVCDEAPECCTFGWDDLCVSRALACDATCMPDPDPTTMTDPTTTGPDPSDTSVTDPDTGPVDTGTTNDGPCCETAGGTGCEDAAVTQCACNLDPYCCQEMWDDYCVAGASQSCGIDCGNDCCTPHATVACNDVEVFGCVVEQDRSCYGAWSQNCVNTAQNSCGLMCG